MFQCNIIVEFLGKYNHVGHVRKCMLTCKQTNSFTGYSEKLTTYFAGWSNRKIMISNPDALTLEIVGSIPISFLSAVQEYIIRQRKDFNMN